MTTKDDVIAALFSKRPICSPAKPPEPRPERPRCTRTRANGVPCKAGVLGPEAWEGSGFTPPPSCIYHLMPDEQAMLEAWRAALDRAKTRLTQQGVLPRGIHRKSGALPGHVQPEASWEDNATKGIGL